MRGRRVLGPSEHVRATCKETVWIDLTVPNSTYVKVMTPGVQYGGSSGSYKVVDDCRKK